MVLTPAQKHAVDKLTQAYLNHDKDKIICFKAPTGSGKTFMASEFISRVFGIEASQPKKTVIVFLTISNAELPKQLTNKLKQYKKFHHGFTNYEIEFIQSPSNSDKKVENLQEFNLKDNKIFVLGLSSFGKNTLFYQNDTLNTFLKQVKFLNYKLIFIRDEAHIGKKATGVDLKSVVGKLYKAAYFSLEMSATPKEAAKIIKLTHEEIMNDDIKLLKGKEASGNLGKILGNNSTEADLIEHVLSQFKKSQVEYAKLKPIIRPALLIQIDNDSEVNPERRRLYEKGLNLIRKKLDEHNFSYLEYLENKKVVKNVKCPATLEYAAKPESMIDVIIIKIGPSIGWDIPRANMLLQLRSVSSMILTIQTIGRILRNPYPGLIFNKTTNKYYIYTNSYSKDQLLRKYNLKDKYQERAKGVKKRKSTKMKLNKKEYINAIKAFIYSDEFKNKIRELDASKIPISSFFFSDEVKKTIELIENGIYLKISNAIVFSYLEKKYQVSKFIKDLHKLEKLVNKSKEVIKYIFTEQRSKLVAIRKQFLMDAISEEVKKKKIKERECRSNYISIIKQNKSNVLSIEQYAYQRITFQATSKLFVELPEEKQLLFNYLANQVIKDKANIGMLFIEKIEKTLIESPIYFEYYNEETNSIKSIKINAIIRKENKIIMFAVLPTTLINSNEGKDLQKGLENYSNINIFHENEKLNLQFVLFSYDSVKQTKQFLYLKEKNEFRMLNPEHIK